MARRRASELAVLVVVSLLALGACWRGGAEPSTPAPPPPLTAGTRKPPPKRAPAVDPAQRLVDEGERAFERGDLAAAEVSYRQAIAVPASPLTMYARYKLAWVNVNLAKDQEALELFFQVARGDNEKLSRVAGDDMAIVYARVGKPQAARAFFERIDNTRTNDRLRKLADNFDMLGKASEAAIVRAQLPP